MEEKKTNKTGEKERRERKNRGGPRGQTLTTDSKEDGEAAKFGVSQPNDSLEAPSLVS